MRAWRPFATSKGCASRSARPAARPRTSRCACFRTYGIARGQIHAERIPNTEIVSRLSDGDIDAAFSGFSPAERNGHRRDEARREAHSHRRPRDRGDADAVSVFETHADSARDVSEPARTRFARSASTRCSSAAPTSTMISCIALLDAYFATQPGDDAAEPRSRTGHADSPASRRGTLLPPARAVTMSRERRGAAGPRKRAAWSGARGPRD